MLNGWGHADITQWSFMNRDWGSFLIDFDSLNENT